MIEHIWNFIANLGTPAIGHIDPLGMDRCMLIGRAFEVAPSQHLLVNMTLYPDSFIANDLNNKRYDILYADPRSLDIIEQLILTGYVK